MAGVVVVMGVCGSGKSTVGRALARRLGVEYAEADDFHPAANVRKMAAGEPLDDADRAPWLHAVAAWMAGRGARGGVVGCSALKRRYRDRLRRADPEAFFVHLDGSEELIAARLASRSDHFMPPSLLASQLADLERLAADEKGATVPIDGPSEETVERACRTVPH